MPRIIGGSPADRNEYPYAQVSLQTSEGHSCGGSVVSSDILLTAAHCHPNPNDIVVVGSYDDINNVIFTSIDSKEFLIEEIVSHPSFEEETYGYDIMLVKVRGDMRPWTNPVRINEEAEIPTLSDTLITVGWGATSVDVLDGVESVSSYPDALQEVNLTYIENTRCEQEFMKSSTEASSPTMDFNLIKDDMMCTYDKGKTACYGDSGGPLLQIRSTGKDPSQDTIQVGVISWSVDCSGNFPTVFHRTSFTFEWIRDMICQLSMSPPDYLACMVGNATSSPSIPTLDTPPSASPIAKTDPPIQSPPSLTPMMGLPPVVIEDAEGPTQGPMPSSTGSNCYNPIVRGFLAFLSFMGTFCALH